MKFSIAVPSNLHARAAGHLIRPDGQEDLCFGLWYPSIGRCRQSALIEQLVMPDLGDREVHGNAAFNPQYLERVIRLAREHDSGIALMHSHPSPGWQGMSDDDISAEQGNAGAILGATGLPLVGLTIGTDGAWSGRFWVRTAPRRHERRWCESVRVVGDRFVPTYNDSLVPKPSIEEELSRTVSAWGDAAQSDLARMTVGIVGAGSVGAIVAEAMARMGIAKIRLLDFDIVKLINLDRQLHATATDARKRRLKVDVLAKHLRLSATADPFEVGAFNVSVVEQDGFKEALDCDILFSCVDRPWARCVLNLIAYAHLIPVVDGGIRLTANRFGLGLKRGTWRAHVAAPGRRCLECLGQYDPNYVSVERSGLLENVRYIDGLPPDHELRRHENVFAFSLSVAALEIQQFLRMVIPHPGDANIGAQIHHFVSGTLDSQIVSCNNSCPFPHLVAKGDRTRIDVTGRDHAAEAVRKGQGTGRWFSNMRVPEHLRSVIEKLADLLRSNAALQRQR